MLRPGRPRAILAGALAIGLAGGVLLGTLGGCSPKKALLAELPPETTVFVQGAADTVNHIVHLYWYGTDADGFVVGYDVRLISPALPADTSWTRTTRSDSVLTISTPTGYDAPTLEVRAVDDDGLIDETPARQMFQFSNRPPTVRITNPLRTTDTTYAAATFQWSASDPDGDPLKIRYRVWMDGNEATPIVTAATSLTVPVSQFRQGGALLTGPRMFFVQAVDDGGRLGNIDSTRWFVRAPVSGNRARLLLIDDDTNVGLVNFQTDTLYANTAIRNLAAGTFEILRLQFTQPFRTAADLAQTLGQYEAVVWYRGTNAGFPSVVQQYQDGIATYLDGGGRVFLEGGQLIAGLNAAGALREDFVTRYFGSDRLHVHVISGVPSDSSANWVVNNGKVLDCSVFGEQLRTVGIFGGVRAFAIRDTNDVILWARVGALSDTNRIDVPIGVSTPRAGGGRAAILTVPIRGANGLSTGPRYLAKLFQQLGLTGP